MTDTILDTIDLKNTEHPYADLIGLTITSRGKGQCTCEIPFDKKLLNPNQVIHGGVIYSMADTSMGGAVHSALREGELCATIEIKITYLYPARGETLSGKATLIKKGSKVAMLESDIYSGDRLVAKATGSFAIFQA